MLSDSLVMPPMIITTTSAPTTISASKTRTAPAARGTPLALEPADHRRRRPPPTTPAAITGMTIVSVSASNPTAPTSEPRDARRAATP